MILRPIGWACYSFYFGVYPSNNFSITKRGISAPSIITCLAVGFFIGSCTFSILSHYRALKGQMSRALAIHTALSLALGALAGSISFFSKSPAKATEVRIIAAGLASPLLGTYFEKKSSSLQASI